MEPNTAAYSDPTAARLIAMAELLQSGEELLQRYRAISGKPFDPQLSSQLREVVALRAPLLRELAGLAAENYGLPQVEAVDATHLKQMIDRIAASIGQVEMLPRRLREAERQWFIVLEASATDAWHFDVQRLLGRLLEDSNKATLLLKDYSSRLTASQ